MGETPHESAQNTFFANNFCAFDAATGKILWHTWMPVLTTNGAQTYNMDGFQFIMVAAQDTVYAYTLNR